MDQSQTARFGNLLDSNGSVKRWPKKKEEKLFVLAYLQTKFEKDRKYSEQEVNSILQIWHTFGDHALLRREMFDNYLLNRTNDGREYWVEREAQ